MRAFDHPAMSARPVMTFYAASRVACFDAALKQMSAAAREVVSGFFTQEELAAARMSGDKKE